MIPVQQTNHRRNNAYVAFLNLLNTIGKREYTNPKLHWRNAWMMERDGRRYRVKVLTKTGGHSYPFGPAFRPAKEFVVMCGSSAACVSFLRSR